MIASGRMIGGFLWEVQKECGDEKVDYGKNMRGDVIGAVFKRSSEEKRVGELTRAMLRLITCAVVMTKIGTTQCRQDRHRAPY